MEFGFLSKKKFFGILVEKFVLTIARFSSKGEFTFCIITGLKDSLLKTVLRKKKKNLVKYWYSLQHILNSYYSVVSGCPLGPVALMGWLPLWAGCPYGLVALVGGYVLRVGGPG